MTEPETTKCAQTSDDQATIGNEVVRYIQHLDGLEITQSLSRAVFPTMVQYAHAQRLKFLESHGEVKEVTETERTFTVKPEYVAELNRVTRSLECIEIGESILPQSFIVSLISQYDVFLGRLLRCLYFLKPEMLNASEKSLSFATLMELGSVENAKEHILEKEIESVLRKSHVDQFAWLEQKFGIELRKDLQAWPAFVELTERRNLFVHTNGVVSSQYLSECRKHGVALDPEIEVGVRLDVPQGYFKRSHSCLLEIGVKLAHVLWRKVNADDMDAADTNLNAVAYELLVLQRYDLALALLEFANITLKKHSNDVHRRNLKLNWAQAYKWLGNNEKCRAIILEDDWTATDDKFKLAVAVLLNNFEEAVGLMKHMGGRGTNVEIWYKDWPIFQEFRKSQLFADAFMEVFGHPFVTEEVTTFNSPELLPLIEKMSD